MSKFKGRNFDRKPVAYGYTGDSIVMFIRTCWCCYEKIYYFSVPGKRNLHFTFDIKLIKATEKDIGKKRFIVKTDGFIQYRYLHSKYIGHDILKLHNCIADGSGSKDNQLKAYINGQSVKVNPKTGEKL